VKQTLHGQNVGPALKQLRGQSRRHRRRETLIGERDATLDLVRQLANEQAQHVLRLGTRAQELLPNRLGIREIDLGATHVDFGHEATFGAHREQLEGSAIRFERGFGELETRVEIPEREIGTRNVRYERNRDGSERLLGR